MIKILTGFDDEPYWKIQSSWDSSGKSKPVIAKNERSQLLPRTRKRRRSEDPLSHKETVQIAAAAAAAAVWSKSLQIAIDNRMQRINSEWDAALRWIAGWDQQLHSTSWAEGKQYLGQLKENEIELSHGGMKSDVSQEGYTRFVDDLAKLLETCIAQCVDDADFEARLRNNNEDVGEISVTSLIGGMISRSFFEWLVGNTSFRLSFGTIETKIVQFVTSSMAMYALLSLWNLAYPVVFYWYSSLGYTESPEWLLEHEKDIQLAKSARLRQKKKAKRRQLTKRSGGRSKPVSSNDQIDPVKKGVFGILDHSDQRPNCSTQTNESSNACAKTEGTLSSVPYAEEWHNESDSGNLAPSSTESVSGSHCSTSSDGVPSMISCPSASVSSFPSIKPSSSLLEDGDPYGEPQQAPSPPVLGLNPKLCSQAPLTQHQKALLVPTQEQRNEAAKQLREFQHAQIQRLLLQRKLSQALSESRHIQASTAAQGCSFHSAVNLSSTFLAASQNKVLKPPPGLSLPSETHTPISNQDFLAENELFLTKLLDDEEDDMGDPSPCQHRIRASSPESSLDPKAVEFFSTKAVNTQQSNSTFPISKKLESDAWKSGPCELSLDSSSPTRMMKGVYGGSVW